MGSFFRNLSSLMNGSAPRPAAPPDSTGAPPTGVDDRIDSRTDARAADRADDGGPSTLTTPLLPLDGPDAQAALGSADAHAASAKPRPRRRTSAARSTSTEGAETVPPGALVELPLEPPGTSRAARAPASSRALHAVVRATTQVVLPTPPAEPAAPRPARNRGRMAVQLTETEKLRLQVMQVQLKLTGLALYDGPIDGMMNPELVEALQHFQTLKNMRDSGLLTAGTLAALGVRPID